MCIRDRDNSDLKLEFEPIDLYTLATTCIDQMQIAAQKNEVTLLQEGGPVTINGNKTLIEELLYLSLIHICPQTASAPRIPPHI